MVRCEICFKEVKNYELHLEEKPRLCRDRLQERWIGKYNERLYQYLNDNPRFYFCKFPAGCQSRKLKTPYYLSRSNDHMIEKVCVELNDIFEDKKLQGLNPTGFGILQLVPMGFIDWQNENPEGIVGLGIRYKIDYD